MKTKFVRIIIPLIVAWTFHPVLRAGGSVITITYYSTTQNTECKMNVYLPQGYNDPQDSVNYYPVFYLIHGGGENYTHWVNSGNAKTTLDEYIAAGKAVPMILVMPDGKNLAPEVFSQELINDIIPYIETHYRVKADKDHRGVGGLSWGGLQAMDAGLYHYELFGYVAVLSSGWFTSETATYNKFRNFLAEHGADMENSIRYLYFSEGTSTDIAYTNGMATLKALRDYGITVHYWEHAGGHSWSAWREDLKSFLPFLFRDSTTRYVSLEFQGGSIVNPTIMTQLNAVIDTPPTPVRTGYSFVGWYKEPECLNSFDFAHDTIKKNITLYAKWTINSYRITFNSNGGSPVNDTIVAVYNSLIKAPADPVRPGYIFDGWYTNTSFYKKWNFNVDRVPAKDITLVAKWIDSASVTVHKSILQNIAVYPNPVTQTLRIANLPADAQVQVYSSDGKLLITKQLKAPADILNTTMLPPGIYRLKIGNAFFEKYESIIVKH